MLACDRRHEGITAHLDLLLSTSGVGRDGSETGAGGKRELMLLPPHLRIGLVLK